MSIKLNKSRKEISCNEFIETDSTAVLETTDAKYPFKKDSNKYKIIEKEFAEDSSVTEIKMRKSTRKLTAKSFYEDGEAVRPLQAIIPEFEVSNGKIYLKEETFNLYRRAGLKESDLIIGIQVKHATFSRGKYKKAIKEPKSWKEGIKDESGNYIKPPQTAPWPYAYKSRHYPTTKTIWKNLRVNGVSPYQLGYQHSGAQFRMHHNRIKNGRKNLLLTRPQRYDYGSSYFTYLTIKSNREVVFVTKAGSEFNAYKYFESHKISNQDRGGKKTSRPHTWLKYKFLVKTSADGTLQSSEFFTVNYNPDTRVMTSMVF